MEIVKKISPYVDPEVNPLFVTLNNSALGCDIVGEKREARKQVKKTQWQDNKMRHCTVLFKLIFPHKYQSRALFRALAWKTAQMCLKSCTAS